MHLIVLMQPWKLQHLVLAMDLCGLMQPWNPAQRPQHRPPLRLWCRRSPHESSHQIHAVH